MKVDVKIIAGEGYIKKGTLGVGFGAWARAAKIRDQLGLGGFPKSVSAEDWRGLNADKIRIVDTNWGGEQ
jgi:hypothetical protein